MDVYYILLQFNNKSLHTYSLYIFSTKQCCQNENIIACVKTNCDYEFPTQIFIRTIYLGRSCIKVSRSIITVLKIIY